jgi:hypothetical protein
MVRLTSPDVTKGSTAASLQDCKYQAVQFLVRSTSVQMGTVAPIVVTKPWASAPPPPPLCR